MSVQWYTAGMSILPTPTDAPAARTRDSKRIAIFYAGILAVMAIAQLFTFDTFLELVKTFGFAGGVGYAYFLAAFLVVAEVFALPFLLRMPLSPAFRWVSMVLGWIAAAIWIKITIWLVTQGSAVVSVGFLGTLVDIMPSWWVVFMSLTFGILAAWSAWGLWPGKRRLIKV